MEVLRTCDDGLPRRSGRGTGADCNQGGDAVEVVWKVYEDGSQGARQSATEESATEEAGEAGRAQADDRRAGPRARRGQEARPVLQRAGRSAQTRRRREPARAGAGGSADDGAGAGACTRAARLVRVTRGRQEAGSAEAAVRAGVRRGGWSRRPGGTHERSCRPGGNQFMLRRLGSGKFREDLFGTDPGHLPRREHRGCGRGGAHRSARGCAQKGLQSRRYFGRRTHLRDRSHQGTPRREEFDGHRGRLRAAAGPRRHDAHPPGRRHER